MLATKAEDSKQQRIWHTVQLIPEGKVATYGQIADLAGLPGRARMVGKALSQVPQDGWQGMAVPWYRVINAQGKISFPVDSEAFVRQKSLLIEEGVVIVGAKIRLFDFHWQPDLSQILFKLKY
ncbi:MGMT family protein [Thalassotalea ganghwensis]